MAYSTPRSLSEDRGDHVRAEYMTHHQQSSFVLTAEQESMNEYESGNAQVPTRPAQARRPSTMQHLRIDPTRLGPADVYLSPALSPYSDIYSDTSFDDLFSHYQTGNMGEDFQQRSYQDGERQNSALDDDAIMNDIIEPTALAVEHTPPGNVQGAHRFSVPDIHIDDSPHRDTELDELRSKAELDLAYDRLGSPPQASNQYFGVSSPSLGRHTNALHPSFSRSSSKRGRRNNTLTENRRGVSPDERKDPSQLEMVKSLNEQQEERERDTKNHDIQTWLKSSAPPSPHAEDPAPVIEHPPEPLRGQLVVPMAHHRSHVGQKMPKPRAASDAGQSGVAGLSRNAGFDAEVMIEDNHEGSERSYERVGIDDDKVDEAWAKSSTSSSGEIIDAPTSATNAIDGFLLRAKMIEPVSRTATYGSMLTRRRSLDSLRSDYETGSLRASPGLDSLRGYVKEKHPRLLDYLKRKPKDTTGYDRHNSADSPHPAIFQRSNLVKMSLNRTPSKSGHHPDVESKTAEGLSIPPTQPAPVGFRNTLKHVVKRTKSKGQDDRRSMITRLFHDHPSPAIPSMQSPAVESVEVAYPEEPSWGEATVTLNALKQPLRRVWPAAQFFGDPLPVPSATTEEAFAEHIQGMFPELNSELLKRAVQHQHSRCERLVACRRGKDNLAGDQVEPAASEPNSAPQPKDRKKSKDPKVYRIGPANSKESRDDPQTGMLHQLAEFPRGMPLPPVSQVPARFECPWCFKSLDIEKPSEWTKHLLEDLQPYICTFMGCSPLKAFKRKADWVRHENELHRQFEWWTCEAGNCQHKTYRKDNFTQHFNRDHSSAKMKADKYVDQWRHESTDKRPEDERCRFCNKAHTQWKELSKCLASHLEQIALALLVLIDRVDRSDEPPAAPATEQLRDLSNSPEHQLHLYTLPTTPDVSNLEVDSSIDPRLLTVGNVSQFGRGRQMNAADNSQGNSRKPSPAPSAASTTRSLNRTYPGLAISQNQGRPQMRPEANVHQYGSTPSPYTAQTSQFSEWPPSNPMSPFEQTESLHPWQSAPNVLGTMSNSPPNVNNPGMFTNDMSVSPPVEDQYAALHAQSPMNQGVHNSQFSPPHSPPLNMQQWHGAPNSATYPPAMFMQSQPSPLLGPQAMWGAANNMSAQQQPLEGDYLCSPTETHDSNATFASMQSSFDTMTVAYNNVTNTTLNKDALLATATKRGVNPTHLLQQMIYQHIAAPMPPSPFQARPVQAQQQQLVQPQQVQQQPFSPSSISQQQFIQPQQTQQQARYPASPPQGFRHQQFSPIQQPQQQDYPTSSPPHGFQQFTLPQQAQQQPFAPSTPLQGPLQQQFMQAQQSPLQAFPPSSPPQGQPSSPPQGLRRTSAQYGNGVRRTSEQMRQHLAQQMAQMQARSQAQYVQQVSQQEIQQSWQQQQQQQTQQPRRSSGKRGLD